MDVRGTIGTLSGAVALIALLACTPTSSRLGVDAGERSAEPGCGVPEPADAVVADLDIAPLVVVQTRDHEVIVYSSDGGLEFTIALARTGALLAERVSQQEFERGFPGLHDHFETAFADEHGHHDDAPTAWAGL